MAMSANEIGPSRVTLYFEDMKADYSKQLLMFDLNTIIGSVGGSMGLFLGFSIFSTIQLALLKAENSFET